MNPSLLLIPDRYKKDKLYSQIPDSGAGDLTFARNSNATRVNSAGLIEKVRANLVLQSETFSNNTAWPKLNSATITANTSVAPDGTTTADTLTLTTNASSSIYQAITTVSELTFSVYAKVASGTKNFRLRFDRISPIESADFTATTTWQRFTFTATTTESGNVYIINDSTGTAGDLIIWGAQLETGDIATDYIPTTTAAVSVGITADIPRLDYTGGGCPSLLLEPQRTNVLTFSEQLNNAAWSVLDNVSVSANVSATLDPSGYNGADKLVENSANDQHRIYRSLGGGGATFSFFAKAAERSWIAVLSNNGSFTYFNIGNGTLGTVAATSTAKITPYGNGWYRCEIYNTHPSFGSLIQLVLANNGTSYLGDGTSGAYIWGCQVEDSVTYATSYIPTLGSSVTRLADAASKTSANTFFGTNTGTIVINFDSVGFDPTQGNYVFDLAAGVDAANRILVYFSPSDSTLRLFYATTAGVTAQQVFSVTMSAIKKIAVKWTASDIKMFYNGTPTASFAFGTTAPNDLTLFARYTDAEHLAARTSQVLTFPTALTDAQCIELTAL
jgi:hypothetical protein